MLARVFNSIIGGAGSKLERALGEAFPEGERYFGLENFGNTCYCNSVLQALYFCVPFREGLLDYHSKHRPATEADETLLTCLADLFSQINSQKRKTGVIAPRRFVQRVKKQKELFRSYMHQDAHEFLNFLLNELVDVLEKEARGGRAEAGKVIQAQTMVPTHTPEAAAAADVTAADTAAGGGAQSISVTPVDAADSGPAAGGVSGAGGVEGEGEDEESGAEAGVGKASATAAAAAEASAAEVVGGSSSSGIKPVVVTWVHEIFQGTLTNETRCLCCETVTARDESFLDLSLDIEQNSSITSCLRNFSSTETLNGNDKFFCDTCASLQEAQKRMRIKVPPRILALHLKRFKYMEQLGRYKKLSYRVVFPMHLRLCNTVDDAPGAEAEYSLFAVIVHVGSGPNHGHYVALVKSHTHWLFFDDENVEPIDESLVQTYFGSSQDFSSNTDHGYFLFYQCTQPELLQSPSAAATAAANAAAAASSVSA